MYTRTFQPVFSEEARAMLSDYLINLAAAGVTGLPRKLESLESTAIALAKLNLKNDVEAQEATETMEFFNTILVHFKQTAIISKNPRDITYGECANILKESAFPLSYDQLIKSACQRNEQVKRYIGEKYDLENNKKVRQVMDLLRQHTHIKVISQRPLALAWIREEEIEESNMTINHLSDLADLADPGICEENKKLVSDNKNDLETERSDRSDRSDSRYINNNDFSSGKINLKTIVEDYFYDDPDSTYRPLPSHSLEQSPCYVVIGQTKGRTDNDGSPHTLYYYCNLHPNVKSVHISTIEHHCKYNRPELHKAEILRLLNLNDDFTSTVVKNNIHYSQLVLSHCRRQ
jgi:hypothetical protein